MFSQLVSNLPFSPSLVHQVSFYAKRMHEESSIRRAGFLLIALAMFIQMFAIVAPPEKSLAASDNHIMNGITTRDSIVNAWNANGSDIPAIYGAFGVTLADIKKLPQQPNATIHSGDGTDWWTIGRNSLSSYARVGQNFKNAEVAVKISTDQMVYMRQLHAWDTRGTSTYQAWQGTQSDGSKFWIIKDCGNFTKIGKFAPNKPGLELRKTIVGSPNSVKPGDTFTYRFEYRNNVSASLANNVKLYDEFDTKNFDIIAPTSIANQNTTNMLVQPLGNLKYNSAYETPIEVTVRLKNPLPAPVSQICNAAKITADNATEAWGGPACVNINVPKAIPAAAVRQTPKLVCSLLDTRLDRSTRTATYKTTVTSTVPSDTRIKSYNYDFGNGKSQSINSSDFTNTTTHTYGAGEFNANVTASYTIDGESANTVHTVTCSDHISFETDKPLSEAKKVKNITQNLEGDKAINSIVRAGDVIEYTLVTTNSQNYDRKGYMISDYIGDVLDYATLDQPFLQQQGGNYDVSSKKITWANTTIGANKDIQKVFRVTMKNPLPATNQPSTVSTTNDCKISNQYGNEITMQVACPAVKGVESLPTTGPGSGALMGFVITTVVGYFFARSRLLAKELDLLRTEYAAGGAY